MKPPFKKAMLPALIDFICTYWYLPKAIEAPINFNPNSKEPS
jgi:hypothetical protein